MSKQFRTLIIFLFFIGQLNAQTANSVYSMFGIGTMTDHSYGINRSLGGTGIAFRSGNYTNFKNPAGYFGITPNTYLMELGGYGMNMKSENGLISQKTSDLNISYFSLGFYSRPWWVMNFSILPFSDVAYEVGISEQIEGELGTYEKEYSGAGGLNKFNFGNSFHLFSGLTFGVNTSYIFGKIDQTETAAASNEFEGYELIRERTAKALYLDYGLQWSFQGNKKRLFSFGLTYGPQKTLNTSDNLSISYNSAIISLPTEYVPNLKIPQKFGIGAAMYSGKNYKIGLDYEFKNWGKINFSNSNLETRNSHRFSVGGEFGSSDFEKSGFFKNLVYRFGAYHQQTYLIVDNVPIDAAGINIGLGIPISRLNRLNVTFEYGQEGSTENSLIKNTHYGVYFNFSMYEIIGEGLFK